MTQGHTVIRAMTLGLPYSALGPEHWKAAGRLFDAAEAQFSLSRIDVRTRRIVLQPLSPESGFGSVRVRAMLRSAQQHGTTCGVRWICLPFASVVDWPGEDIRSLGPVLIKENPSLFLHYMLPEEKSAPLAPFLITARAVSDIARLSHNGFDNFRVGAGVNIRPNTPFFPFSWHSGEYPCFTFAVESLESCLSVLDAKKVDSRDSVTLSDAMSDSLVDICRVIDRIGRDLEAAMDGAFTYGGLDISLAPFPDDRHSLACLMEGMGLHAFGGLGTTTCTEVLTRALRRALLLSKARMAGFNGVMFSPLEDRGIARRLRDGYIPVEAFLLWSTVCGCGVDMLPIEGTTPLESIAALYQDTCSLSIRHDKPLGVRVLPVPGGRLNQPTQYNHDFLVNCHITALRGGLGEEMHD